MKRSTDRILTTLVGSLVRPPDSPDRQSSLRPARAAGEGDPPAFDDRISRYRWQP